jgi:hypothetical protein
VRRIVRPTWVAGTIVTEYWPSPERWFGGRLVRAPGLPGRHPADWLYSARGLAMEGTGIARDGRLVHFAGPFGGDWLNAAGGVTRPCPSGGAWTNGRPVRIRFPQRARFGLGPGRSVRFWRSVAVDPRLIPLGSRIFLRDYCATPAHGWFRAEDTGSAIRVAHIDVYRPPPATPSGGRMLRGRRMFVVPPGTRARRMPHC